MKYVSAVDCYYDDEVEKPPVCHNTTLETLYQEKAIEDKEET